MMIFVGIDWAEAHHDVCVLDACGVVLATCHPWWSSPTKQSPGTRTSSMKMKL